MGGNFMFDFIKNIYVDEDQFIIQFIRDNFDEKAQFDDNLEFMKGKENGPK
jgi:predicted nucleic-acid-binding protein